MQHTHANCGFRRMLASQVLMSGDNATLSCFQIIFWLGNLEFKTIKAAAVKCNGRDWGS